MAARGVALVAGAGPGIGNFNVEFREHFVYNQVQTTINPKTTFCLSLTVCLSGGENVTRARGRCSLSQCRTSWQKSIVSNLRFVRTRPQHWSQGQRCTGRIGEQRESQKGQSDAQILIVETNELRRVSSKNTLVTMPLPGAAVARRFAREGFTVAVARYKLPHLVTITTAEERL